MLWWGVDSADSVARGWGRWGGRGWGEHRDGTGMWRQPWGWRTKVRGRKEQPYWGSGPRDEGALDAARSRGLQEAGGRGLGLRRTRLPRAEWKGLIWEPVSLRKGSRGKWGLVFMGQTMERKAVRHRRR